MRNALVFLAAALLAAAAPSSPARAASSENLAPAAVAVTQLDFDRAVTLLRAVPVEGGGSPRYHYLFGVALFGKTEEAVLTAREAGQKADALTPAQAESYREALAHLEKAIALDPGGADTADARFRAALLTDYGYLQRLGQTMDKYREVMKLHPGTEAAEKARLRVEGREGLFKIH